MEKETIAAIATPFGSGGIGIIRISGPQASAIAEILFRGTAKVSRGAGPTAAKAQFSSHRLNHGYIVDGDRIVDEVLLAVMKAPHSYTREDVVEIQSHAGAVVLHQILNMVLMSGARLAEPGEFTKRAYLNGRIDLSQAEAVADVITAKSEAALSISTHQLMGAIKNKVEDLVGHINQALVDLQAHLEFSDDIENEVDLSPLTQKLSADLIAPIKMLLARYDTGYLYREGIRMGIVGRPNVGKSSLLNYLLRKDKAIVTHLPGTTRDLIEDTIIIDGVPIIVTDTAGLHDTDNPVERIGIQKTHENISISDLVLFVVDGSQPVTTEDEAVYATVQANRIIIVVNKIDLVQGCQVAHLPAGFDNHMVVNISAKTGQGISELEQVIVQQCSGNIEISPGRDIVPNLRQKIALELGLGSLERAHESLNQGLSHEFIVEDLEDGRKALNQVLGQNVDVDILDEIFSRFCIGK